jgi:hypothetical protein
MTMMKNEGTVDRVLRTVLGIVLMVVGFGVVGGTGGTILGVVGLVPLITGVVGFCPIYTLLHIRTDKA